jgi:WS/DGAT/MGAT family acyltransferase
MAGQMTTHDRLSALDAAFLDLEDEGVHMHVASIAVFDGSPPSYDELLGHVAGRLHLVPRFRQRLAEVPLGQGRPVWVDDPHFNLRYHVRHSALPAPGSDAELERLASRLVAQRLDRSKPLWEIWLVEGLSDGAFALVAKTHHALVDGVSGVDLSTVLLDASADPAPVPLPERAWTPRPLPTGVQLLGEALVERATRPGEAAKLVREVVTAPVGLAGRALRAVSGVAAVAQAGLYGAPPSPLNVRIGPHRRCTWLDVSLDEVRAVKRALGGTVNDVALAAVTGALRRFLLHRGRDVSGLVLKAMVPVSVRADVERGALGNRVAAMYAPLPVGLADPAEQLDHVRRAMAGLKASGQAVGAEALTGLAEFAPPTILAQAARLQARQPFHNLVVTNVPGPQHPLFLLGRRLIALYPLVPLTTNTALGVAMVSYDGRLGIGLLGDYDALDDLDVVARGLEEAFADLAGAAGVEHRPSGRRRASGPRAGRAAAASA